MPVLIWTQYGLAEDNGSGGRTLHTEARQAREGRGHDAQRIEKRNEAQRLEQMEPRERLQRSTEEIAEHVHERLARQVRHNRLEASDQRDPHSTRGESELQHGMKMPKPRHLVDKGRRMGALEFGLVAEQLKAAYKKARNEAKEKRRVSNDRMRVEQIVSMPRQRNGR